MASPPGAIEPVYGNQAAGRLPGPAVVLARQVGYQVRLLTRTPRALWLAIFAPAGLLALRLGRIGHPGGHPAPAANQEVIALVAGLAVFGLLNTAFLTHAAGLVVARQDGVLRRWRLSPLPAGGYFAGRIIATVLLAEAGGLVVVVLGIVLAGLRLPAGAVAGLVAAFTAGAVAWAALGTAVTIVVPSAEATFPVTGLVYLPLVLLSGVLGPFPGELGWLSWTLSYLPAQPLVDAVATALRDPGGRLLAVPGHDLAVLACWAVAGVLICLKFFRWAPQVPARGRHPAAFLARGDVA
jgi:ABC-2 type transport system permease protein